MILIVGAGSVGTNIAFDLAETHDVTVVDRDAERIDSLTSQLDTAGVVGDGRSITTLQEAGIDRADIVIASTDSDAANIMISNAAKQSGDPQTIARVKDVGLFRTWQSLDGGLGVDTMLCIDLLAAEAIVRTIALPGALAVDTFADGQVEVAEFRIGDDTPVTGSTVAEADRYPSATFAAVIRDDGILIPDGDTVFQAGDNVVVIGSQHGVRRFAKEISSQPTLDSDDNVQIVGGNVLGFQIAQQFEDRGFEPQIVERDPERAVGLTNQVGQSVVAEANIANIGGYSPDFLTNADLVIGAVDDDSNYLLAQLAREMEVDRAAATVDDPGVVQLFEETGLDVVVHPQDIIAGEILQGVYGPGPEDVGVFEHDQAEVLEIVIDEDSILAGKSLGVAGEQLPAGVVIGAIVRRGELKTPRGGTIIQTDDRVIAFVDADVAREITGKL